jgi:hypothetical protein
VTFGRLGAGVLLSLVAGCGSPAATSEPSQAADAGPGTLGDRDIELLAAHYATFAKASRVAFPTRGHLGNPLVDVYANAVASPVYSVLSSTGSGPPGFALPVGSMLVKEMRDSTGAPSVLTVMYKKAPGFDPPHHDWWYGRLNTDGTPTDPSYVGQVSFCIACHAGATGSDFAWGVPAADK